jgi:hypothetical protein
VPAVARGQHQRSWQHQEAGGCERPTRVTLVADSGGVGGAGIGAASEHDTKAWPVSAAARVSWWEDGKVTTMRLGGPLR